LHTAYSFKYCTLKENNSKYTEHTVHCAEEFNYQWTDSTKL